jgi:ankyrin repeat protein
MHTALMEASMDGHVEVARLLLDSGAQVFYTLGIQILFWYFTPVQLWLPFNF